MVENKVQGIKVLYVAKLQNLIFGSKTFNWKEFTLLQKRPEKLSSPFHSASQIQHNHVQQNCHIL